MRSIDGQSWWTKWATFVGAAAVAVAFQVGTPIGTSKVFAAYELPPGEMITNSPAIPRSMPQKEAYELYDPKIGGNFDIKNFWMRADLRVRPEFRTHTCFGSTNQAAGACNSFNGAGVQQTGTRGQANDFYVQQWVRLGIGYDLSPDVNFYMEIIDSATWGGNGVQTNAGNAGDPLNHNCSSVQTGACRLGVRAAYVLVRNLAGVQGLSMKAGRQYIVLGNHSLFGHFDWANTGYSHDGIMFQYSTKAFDSYLGWFRNSESDLPQAAPVGSGSAPVAGGATNTQDASRDVDMILFYNQLKSIPGFLVEPYYVYYKNNFASADNGGQGIGTAKHSNQTRHMVGNRLEMRKGNFDAIQETSYQFGAMGAAGGVNAAQGAQGNQKNLHINAWAMRNWLGYTHYQSSWKPRLAINFDYASGDGRANCTISSAAAAGGCKSANTFENFFPTNHIHMGYMDIMAWKNMIQPGANLQFRPTAADHVEFWWTNMNLASKQDNWYRGGQGVYIFSKPGNTKRHIGDELDITYTHLFADGKVAFQMTYGHMFTGGYISDNLGTSNDQAWGYAQVWMNF